MDLLDSLSTTIGALNSVSYTLNTIVLEVNDFAKKRILEAFKAEFDTRGMKMVESDAGATISIYEVIDNKTSTTAYTSFNGGMGYGTWVVSEVIMELQEYLLD